MWVRPSAREKQQMKLREQARKEGMQVQMVKVKDPDHPLDEKRCLAYRLVIPQINGKVTSWTCTKYKSNSEYNWRIKPAVIQAKQHLFEQFLILLNNFPDDCFKIERNNSTVSAYWLEQGALEAVTQMHADLGALAEINTHSG